MLKKRLVKPCFDMLRLPAMARMFGGGTAGRKIAQYILAVRRGNLDADFDLLPTDKYEHEEVAEKKAKPVKPTRKERTVKQARKTKPDNVAKPLEKSEIESGKEQESSQDQSNPVKVNQTDLAPISPTGPASPIRPPRPPLPIPPEEDSEARELQKVTELAEEDDASSSCLRGCRPCCHTAAL